MRCFIGVLLVSCNAFAASAAALRNASFEDPADSSRTDCVQAAGWEAHGEWVRRETGWQPRHWGSCMMGYHHWRIADQGTSGFFQDVADVPPDAACRFLLFVLSDTDANFRSLEIRLEPKGGGKPLAAKAFNPKSLKPGDWRVLSVSGRSPAAGGVRVSVVLTPAKDLPRRGSVKFDDASLDVGVQE